MGRVSEVLNDSLIKLKITLTTHKQLFIA